MMPILPPRTLPRDPHAAVRLIAAAPDLLVAAREALAFLDREEGHAVHSSGSLCARCELRATLSRVIAEAEEER
jgi:hypothetical protein